MNFLHTTHSPLLVYTSSGVQFINTQLSQTFKISTTIMSFKLFKLFLAAIALAVACGSANGAVVRGSGATPSVTSAAANSTTVAQDRGFWSDLGNAIGDGINSVTKAITGSPIVPTPTKRKECTAALTNVALRRSCDVKAGITKDTAKLTIKGKCEEAGCCFGLSPNVQDLVKSPVPVCYNPAK